jgi:hypothetical protein
MIFRDVFKVFYKAEIAIREKNEKLCPCSTPCTQMDDREETPAQAGVLLS